MQLCTRCQKHPRMHHRTICSWCHSDDVNARHRRKHGEFVPRMKRKRMGLATLKVEAAKFGLNVKQYLEALKCG